jgi:chorismate synthase
MNTFGTIFRVALFGESHGPAVGVLIDGCPAGLPLETSDFHADLARRRGGAPGTTARREPDAPLLESGLFEGHTTGAPLLIRFANIDVDSRAYEALRGRPRPGHADLVARQKFGGFADPRGSGHHSGRLTVGLVAAGVVAKKLLRPLEVAARLVAVGGSEDIEATVAAAQASGDSVGGLIECRARHVPAGLGEPFFDTAESLLAHALFAIPAIKGVEFGAGFAAARMRGSEHNDPILDVSGASQTNHAGGVLGGITTGNELLFRVAVKPTPSIRLPQRTVDLGSGAPAEISVGGRHDACIALRVPVILEAVTAIVLADLSLLAGRLPRALTP